eukprot:3447020-Pyramimonas_sp.AAC.1
MAMLMMVVMIMDDDDDKYIPRPKGNGIRGAPHVKHHAIHGAVDLLTKDLILRVKRGPSNDGEGKEEGGGTKSKRTLHVSACLNGTSLPTCGAQEENKSACVSMNDDDVYDGPDDDDHAVDDAGGDDADGADTNDVHDDEGGDNGMDLHTARLQRDTASVHGWQDLGNQGGPLTPYLFTIVLRVKAADVSWAQTGDVASTDDAALSLTSP